MKDDYLWDRSGQPDPDIQQLEEILGELRYQPRPLEIPVELKTRTNRFQFSRVAIAAAIAMLVFGAGAWMAIQKQDTQVAMVPQPPPTEVKPVTEVPKDTMIVVPKEDQKVTTPRPVRIKSHRSRTIRTPKLSSEQIAEAVAAKNQLMMALRLTSSKLNYAQKKTQGSNPATPVYHQHKIG